MRKKQEELNMKGNSDRNILRQECKKGSKEFVKERGKEEW